MQSINELIGVIKGISFDNVINEKETEYLSLWVNKNRNLAYKTEEADFIKMIDDILEDNVIDAEEKELLLKKANEFSKNELNEKVLIGELNGIIEGVICDNEINEKEVYCLKNWMGLHGDIVRNNKSTKELSVLIDKIIEDGIVTKDEQAELLNVLNNRLKTVKFEEKLEYLRTLIRNKKSIGIELIDILDNADALTIIHKKAEYQLMKSLISDSGLCSDREIIVISLVLIAMLNYDGNFYKYVDETYKKVCDKFGEPKVKGKIRSILDKYKKQNESSDRKRIIDIALEKAIVPQPYLAAFFDFIYDIYKVNFEYDLSVDMYEDFRFVYEGLSNNMSSDEDDVSIKVTKKTYKLIVSTKHLLLSEEGLDAIIKLSIIVVKLIDKRYWNKDKLKIINPYLKVGFEIWEKSLEKSKRTEKDNKGIVSEFRSRWEPKFVYDNGLVYIIPPVHRVKSIYNYEDISIVLYNGEDEIYRDEEPYIKEIIGGYQLNSDKIKLSNPLGKLEYRLVCGDEIIYSSKNKLNRKYIVFNNDGQEISNNTDYEGGIYICHKSQDEDFQNIISEDNYNIDFLIVRDGKSISIENDLFNFSSMVKPGIFGREYGNCYVCDENGKRLKIYEEVKVAVFEAENISDKFEIIINGKPNKISEMEYTKTKNESTTKYILDLNLIKNGIYSLKINQFVEGKKNAILDEEFVLDKDLKFNGSIFEESNYNAKVNSSLLSSELYFEGNIDDFEIDFIKFEYNDKKYSFIFPFDFGLYSIDENEWVNNSKEIWIGDIDLTSTMRILDSKCNGMIIYNDKGNILEDNIEIKDKGIYKEIPIGFINSYKNENAYVLIVFTVNDKKKHSMICYNKCIIDEERTEIICSDFPEKTIEVKPVFHGKNTVYFEMMDKNDNIIYKSSKIKSEQIETISEFNSFEDYTFNFYEKPQNLLLAKKKLIYSVVKKFYAREDYVGKIFKIDEGHYYKYDGDEPLKKEFYFNKSYVKIIKVTPDCLIGKMLVITDYNRFELKNINPVQIEIYSDVLDDKMEVFINKEGDGLLLDYKNKGIMDAIEHPTAPDIYLFILNLKGALIK